MSKNKIGVILLLLVLGTALALAHSGEDFSEAQKLVESQAECSSLSDEQLEKIGDYYMEQMHPGEAHELMDQMHGGEGSAQLKQMHIFMAKKLYCKEENTGGGMMGLGGMTNNMMGGGMMGGGGFPMMGFGSMMGYAGNSGVYGILGGITWIALVIFLVAGAYFFIKQAGKK